MNPDPAKQMGKIREQNERENIARRRYQHKWGKLADKDMNRFYNQNYINEMMGKFEDSENEKTNPFSYTGSGESFFITKDLYESLVATCRCGRPKTRGHVVKCLQKGQCSNLELGLDNSSSSDKDHSIINKVEFAESKQHQSPDKGKSSIISDSFDVFKQHSFPQTSSGLIGWPKNRYHQLEKATRYISPTYNMVGPKITDIPYDHIFIG
ncbi:hypothetical protein ACFFRR_010339 [Megaselia abdita]